MLRPLTIRRLLLASCTALAFGGIVSIPIGARSAGIGLATSLDPTGTGPYKVAESEYRLPATIDPLVDTGVVTEIWGQVYRPLDGGHGSHPLLVLLHGNHATCGHYVRGTLGRVDDNSQYTTKGTCPAGYIVVPNHLGYGYVAERLASLGYLVVSINANRGINAAAGVTGDRGLNLRRGRLVLRHLQLLAQWNRSGGAPASLGFDLSHTMDFRYVGLMGHSRGGEGMLAAYTMYHDAGSIWPAAIGTPINFQAMFELAPVDGQTGRTFVANNIPWTVLLPLCDGDVSDVQGVKVYDRTLESLTEKTEHKKSVYAVWGANHDFFNTQWQTSDSKGCSGPGNTPLFDVAGDRSTAQQTASTYAIMSLIRAHVGSQAFAAYGMLLDPAFALPRPLAAVSTFERSFSDGATPGPVLPLEDFNVAGIGSTGLPDTASHVTFADTAVPNHDTTLKAGAISWDWSRQAAGSLPYFQVNYAPPGSGARSLPYQTLEFRIALQCTTRTAVSNYACAAPSPLNGGVPTDFSVALVRPDGSLSHSVALSDYAKVQGPVGGAGDNLHPVLQTVRVPFLFFGDFSAPYRGVRFTFDRTPSGAIWLANIRASSQSDLLLPVLPPDAHLTLASATASVGSGLSQGPAAATLPFALAGGAVGAIRNTAPAAANAAPGLKIEAAAAPQVEIELSSQAPIPVRDSLLTLDVGGVSLTQSRFADDGRTDRAIFTLSAQEFAALPQDAPLTLIDGSERSSYGTLDKTALH
jgi:hypothetical protein